MTLAEFFADDPVIPIGSVIHGETDTYRLVYCTDRGRHFLRLLSLENRLLVRDAVCKDHESPKKSEVQSLLSNCSVIGAVLPRDYHKENFLKRGDVLRSPMSGRWIIIGTENSLTMASLETGLVAATIIKYKHGGNVSKDDVLRLGASLTWDLEPRK